MQAVECFLDIDGGDVVGEQNDFIGVQLVLVFVQQVFRRNEARLQQADEECAGAGEGVDDVDVFFAQARFELVAQDVLHAVDDEVDHFDRRVDDAQPLGHAGEGGAKELIVQFNDDLLPGLGVVHALGAVADAGVKLFELLGFLFHATVRSAGRASSASTADGVVLREGVVGKQAHRKPAW